MPVGETPNFGLTQYVGTDIPKWIGTGVGAGSYNGDMLTIDGALDTLTDTLASEVTDREAAISTHDHDGVGDIQIAHTNLTAIGSNTHAQIDTHITNHNKITHDALGLDHGELSGKSDDDHSQYLNETRHTALAGDHVENGDSHNHNGGDGAQIDHGGLAGLGDDDHSQYHNSTRHNANDHANIVDLVRYADWDGGSGISGTVDSADPPTAIPGLSITHNANVTGKAIVFFNAQITTPTGSMTLHLKQGATTMTDGVRTTSATSASVSMVCLANITQSSNYTFTCQYEVSNTGTYVIENESILVLELKT